MILAYFRRLTSKIDPLYGAAMVSEENRLEQAFIFSRAFMVLCALRRVPVGNTETRTTARIWKELRKIMAGRKAMSADEQRSIGGFVEKWRELGGLAPLTSHADPSDLSAAR